MGWWVISKTNKTGDSNGDDCVDSSSEVRVAVFDMFDLQQVIGPSDVSCYTLTCQCSHSFSKKLKAKSNLCLDSMASLVEQHPCSIHHCVQILCCSDEPTVLAPPS